MNQRLVRYDDRCTAIRKRQLCRNLPGSLDPRWPRRTRPRGPPMAMMSGRRRRRMRFADSSKTACEVFFAFNGTAANALSLAALCQSYHSVICSEDAHVETDECGAPEFFSNGSKLLVARSADGKLTPDAIRAIATNRNDIHFPKPRAVTITQPTETGQVYCHRGIAGHFGLLPGAWSQSPHGRGRASPTPVPASDAARPT